jgi:hypothetical protein
VTGNTLGIVKSLRRLGFDPLKSKDKFLENYQLSDKAARIGDKLLRSNGFDPIPFGEDRRHERVWEEGKDKPDRKILKNDREIALLDWKGKSKDYWMINERAYNGYVAWSIKLKLPVYVAIWSFQSDQGRFTKLPLATISRTTQWDKNVVIIFDPRELRPWNTLAAELNSL